MIGNWDNSKVEFAVLPASLKNGDNPSDFTTGFFPVYSGPNASKTYIGELSGGPLYSDGVLLISEGVHKYLKINHYLESNPSNKFTVVSFIRTNGSSYDITYPVIGSFEGFSNGVVCAVFPFTEDHQDIEIITFKDGARDFVITTTTSEYITSGFNTLVYVKDGLDASLYLNGILLISGGSPDQTVDMEDFNLNTLLGSYGEDSCFATFQSRGEYKSLIYYNDALTPTEIEEGLSLGPSLGLEGYDQGDGTMRLEVSATPTTPRTNSKTITTDIAYFDGNFRLGDWIP